MLQDRALLRNLGFASCYSPLGQEIFTFPKHWTIIKLVWSSHFVLQYKQGELTFWSCNLWSIPLQSDLKTCTKLINGKLCSWAEIFLILGVLKALAELVIWFVTNQRHFQKGLLECFHFCCCYWHDLLNIKVDHRFQECVTPVFCLWCFDPVLGEKQRNKRFCLALSLKIHLILPLPVPPRGALISLGGNTVSRDLTHVAFLFCSKILTAQKAVLFQVPGCFRINEVYFFC